MKKYKKKHDLEILGVNEKITMGRKGWRENITKVRPLLKKGYMD